ncbi:hypothetical protein QVD17_21475 [Tagetes erecta]|uniref:C2H2-type domain-containing protein n=1 Tax=Tagetes erecta TaxID=13708 RepID=A0AAD8KC06_TARER|nr:hypothetical protein QVD17_21475 [Tagetes erecta]
MEKQHKCKLCLKTFENGRALGGHMRSHMLNPTPPHSPSPSLSSSDLSRNVTVRQRSKRNRRSECSWFDQFPVTSTSVSDTSPEELVAYCLIMLSRDKWTHEQEQEQEEEIESELDEVIRVKKTPARNSFRCETCNKIFRSYQALGGHIASHKKVKLSHQFHHNSNQEALNVSIEDKIYECHVCFKVFASGQALGGHKRSHVTSKQAVKPSMNLFDLNLPAPSDDDD